MRPDAETMIRQAIEQLRGPDGRGANRETALAITKLEEALLWLVYGPKLK